MSCVHPVPNDAVHRPPGVRCRRISTTATTAPTAATATRILHAAGGRRGETGARLAGLLGDADVAAPHALGDGEQGDGEAGEMEDEVAGVAAEEIAAEAAGFALVIVARHVARGAGKALWGCVGGLTLGAGRGQHSVHCVRMGSNRCASRALFFLKWFGQIQRHLRS